VTTQWAPCGQGRFAEPAPVHLTVVVVLEDPKAGAAMASTTPNVISTKASFLMTKPSLPLSNLYTPRPRGASAHDYDDSRWLRYVTALVLP
jgi:hypothetical protein